MRQMCNHYTESQFITDEPFSCVIFFFFTWHWPTWSFMCAMSCGNETIWRGYIWYVLVASRWKCCWPLTTASSVQVRLGASCVPHVCPLISCPPLSTVKERAHCLHFDLNYTSVNVTTASTRMLSVTSQLTRRQILNLTFIRLLLNCRPQITLTEICPYVRQTCRHVATN